MRLLSSFFFIISWLSCSKYEQNSIYHIDKLPAIETNENFEYVGDSIKFSAKILEDSESKILRYGHIWGHDSILNISNKRFRKIQQTNVKDFYILPLSFQNVTKDFEKDKVLYFNSFAINEAGISYGKEYKLCSEVYFDRYDITQETVLDNKISPGETVTLKMIFKNNSPISSINPKIQDIPQSNFLTIIGQNNNINLQPNILTQNNQAHFFVTVKIASNANTSIDFKVFLKDNCSDKNVDIKTKDKKNLKIIIN
jgi:uncharacterized repeat protein (TIGR01451 family)